VRDRILVIDDDPGIREVVRRVLTADGYEVTALDSAEELESTLATLQPHLLLCDVMMPGRDGLEICRIVRADPQCAAVPIIVMTAKLFEEDRRAALLAGATECLQKPFENERLTALVAAQLRTEALVTLCGVRGSIAVPELGGGRYGGNTSCLSLALPGQRHLIFDAGTGIRRLGKQLATQSPLQLALCLTHFHWDHIFGLPFFAPLYLAGNEVHLCGPAENDAALVEKIHVEMGGDYFPVSIEAFRATLHFHGLGEQEFQVLGAQLSTHYAMHPRRTLAYRLEFEGQALVYAPDNELLGETTTGGVTGEAARFARFAHGAALLIHDCTYSNAEYARRRGWGHSAPAALAAVALAAEVERVVLFHHDPDNDDDAIDAIYEEFLAALPPDSTLMSEPAREGASYPLGFPRTR